VRDRRRRSTDISSYLEWRQNGKIEPKSRKKNGKKVYEVKEDNDIDEKRKKDDKGK
jgi:hypothetical protein